MKNRILIVLLCIAVLLVPAAASSSEPGSQSDPLISLSYIENTFRPAVSDMYSKMASDAVSSFNAAQAEPLKHPSVKTVSVASGGKITFTEGQYFVLLSGSGRIGLNSGSVVNASVGFEASNGAANRAQRYIVCEASKATLTLTADSVVYCSGGAVVTDAIAVANKVTVDLDGRKVEFDMYKLTDENGGDTNYIKLRDVAYHLNGTPAQFSVNWDGNVNLVTGESYGSGLQKMPFSGDWPYRTGAAITKVNGSVVDLLGITLTDQNQGDYNYYKLRDLGKALGFNVSWSAERGIYVETDRPYTADS